MNLKQQLNLNIDTKNTKLSETVERKFIDSVDVSDWEIETDSGFVPITHVHKTIEYDVWRIETEDGSVLECADTHIVFDEFLNEIFVKDCVPNKTKIMTRNGSSKVVSVQQLSIPAENMYDLSLNSVDKRFYSGNILSHNSSTVCGFILWYVIFNEDKMVALMANKGDTAREILGRIQLAYQHLPKWLQQGIGEWNKGSMLLENRSRVIAAATSASAIRGFSCVTGDTKVCIEEKNNIYYVSIDYLLLNNSEFVNVKDDIMENKKYAIYKTTNTINNKIYIGFHSVKSSSQIKQNSISGSIFEDGYLGSGKLIKRSIEKYGPETFNQELLAVFDNKKEAELYEKNLVNLDFCEREDTYNTSLGGHVCVLYGENNGFYGKTHSEEFKESQRQNKLNNKDFSSTHDCKIIHVESNKEYLDFIEFKKEYPDMTKRMLYREIAKGVFRYSDETRQTKALEYCNSLLSEEEKSKLLADLARERFTGVVKTNEQKEKIGKGVKSFIESHPEEHMEKMLKINKNPEKIRKTAEKHRGMKRSEETKLRISLALRNKPSPVKGKVSYHDPASKKIIFIAQNTEPPEGYIKGRPKRK